MSKKKRKAKARAQRRIIESLVNPQPTEIIIDGPTCDPQDIWREHVTEFAAGYIEDDGRDWSYWKPNGYL